MPFPSAKQKINFDELDAPEYWCEFKTMAGMKYAEAKELFGGDDDTNDNYGYVESLLSKMILGWNIPEVEGGEVLPIPAVDPTVVNKIPNVFIQKIVEVISGSDGRDEEENLGEAS
jgi:hypothetical protein